MKLYKKIAYLLIASIFGFWSCTEDDGPSVDDNFLNYEIPEIPVTQDYAVGAYYIDNGGGVGAAIWGRLTGPWDAKAGLFGPTVTPVLGNWSNVPSELAVNNIQQQVDWAIEGGIDFFVLPGISENANALYPNNLNANNLRLANLITGKIGSDGLGVDTTKGKTVDLRGKLKYVLMLNAGNLNSNLNNKTPVENVASTVIEGKTVTRVQRYYDVVKRMADFFSDPNYYTVDGRPMIIIQAPQNTFSLDSKKFYDDMRAYIKQSSGKDIYIVAQQPCWTPAARFQYTFGEGRVDAVTIQNDGGMYRNTNIQRYYQYPQMIDQNWKFNKDYFMSTWGEDFIPAISPSFCFWVNSGGNYNNPIVEKDPKTFATYCNVAKMNIGTKRMVIIDSWNHWNYDSAIEPTDPEFGNGYGTQYLEIVKKQFKR